jgi:hypothetical protein
MPKPADIASNPTPNPITAKGMDSQGAAGFQARRAIADRNLSYDGELNHAIQQAGQSPWYCLLLEIRRGEGGKHCAEHDDKAQNHNVQQPSFIGCFPTIFSAKCSDEPAKSGKRNCNLGESQKAGGWVKHKTPKTCLTTVCSVPLNHRKFRYWPNLAYLADLLKYLLLGGLLFPAPHNATADSDPKTTFAGTEVLGNL